MESVQLRARQENYSKQLKPISEWETFKNNNLSLTFKYPKDIFLVDSDENFDDEPNPSRIFILNGIYDNVWMRMNILPDEYLELLDLNVGESSLYEYHFGTTEVTTRLPNETIAGIESYVFYTPQIYEQIGPIKQMVVPIEDEYYQFYYTDINLDSRNAGISYRFIFKDILSSLQFTE